MKNVVLGSAITGALRIVAVMGLLVALAGCEDLLGGNDPETYSVSYDGNGSTGGSVPTDSGEYEEGDTVTVAENTGSLSLTNQIFAGWNSAADGSGTDYEAGSSLTMGSNDVTLYAKWSPDPRTIDSSDTMTIDGTEYEIDNFLVGDFGNSSSPYILELFFSTDTRSFEDDGNDALEYPGGGSFVGMVLRSSNETTPAAGKYQAVMDDSPEAGHIVGGELQHGGSSDLFGGQFQDGDGLDIAVDGDTYTITGTLRYGRDTNGDDVSDSFVSVTIDLQGALTGDVVDLSGINL